MTIKSIKKRVLLPVLAACMCLSFGTAHANNLTDAQRQDLLQQLIFLILQIQPDLLDGLGFGPITDEEQEKEEKEEDNEPNTLSPDIEIVRPYNNQTITKGEVFRVKWQQEDLEGRVVNITINGSNAQDHLATYVSAERGYADIVVGNTWPSSLISGKANIQVWVTRVASESIYSVRDTVPVFVKEKQQNIPDVEVDLSISKKELINSTDKAVIKWDIDDAPSGASMDLRIRDNNTGRSYPILSRFALKEGYRAVDLRQGGQYSMPTKGIIHFRPSYAESLLPINGSIEMRVWKNSELVATDSQRIIITPKTRPLDDGVLILDPGGYNPQGLELTPETKHKLYSFSFSGEDLNRAVQIEEIEFSLDTVSGSVEVDDVFTRITLEKEDRNGKRTVLADINDVHDEDVVFDNLSINIDPSYNEEDGFYIYGYTADSQDLAEYAGAKIQLRDIDVETRAQTKIDIQNTSATVFTIPEAHVFAGINYDRIVAMGVYEGSYPSGVRHSFNYHPQGEVEIEVDTPGEEVVLVLSSYEPVDWQIEDDSHSVVGVILSGYHEQEVSGIPSSVPIVNTSYKGGDYSDYFYTYQRNTSGYGKMERAVRNLLQDSVDEFAGKYSASRFDYLDSELEIDGNDSSKVTTTYRPRGYREDGTYWTKEGQEGDLCEIMHDVEDYQELAVKQITCTSSRCVSPKFLWTFGEHVIDENRPSYLPENKQIKQIQCSL